MLKKIVGEQSPLRELIFNVWARVQGRGCAATPGSADWLIGKEMAYGGLHTGVKRNKVSPLDPRTAQEICSGGMIGGDRMYHHGYAPAYARHLEPFVNASTSITLVEVGILRGTGLAIWCDLFPRARIIGLDIDLGHFIRNREQIRLRGGFEHNEPEVYEFDQLIENKTLMAEIMNGGSMDICIDDGSHQAEAILTTFQTMAPFLADKFSYFIEDNAAISQSIVALYPEFCVSSYGELTVVERG